MGSSFGSGAGRIVAVGDLHGNYEGFRRILQAAGLIDRRDAWCARDTRLVQLGDVLGRGGEPGKIFRLLQRLEEEAPALGSEVHLLLGNHEAMSMSGMLMYNTREELLDLARADLLEEPVAVEALAAEAAAASAPRTGRRLEPEDGRTFRESLSPSAGRLGRWLAGHDTAVAIDGTLFVHGGLNRDCGLMPLDALNATVRRELLAPAAPPVAPEDADWSPAPAALVLRRDGPQWNRDYTLRPDEARRRELEEVLSYHGCARMVVGHTPTSCIDPDRRGEIVSLYNGRLVCADVGIGVAYGGNLACLTIAGNSLSALYP